MFKESSVTRILFFSGLLFVLGSKGFGDPVPEDEESKIRAAVEATAAERAANPENLNLSDLGLPLNSAFEKVEGFSATELVELLSKHRAGQIANTVLPQFSVQTQRRLLSATQALRAKIGRKKSPGNTVYFMWGGLEKEYIDAEYQYTAYTINAFRAAGWNVVVDGYTTKSEALIYFARSNMAAFFWSSHGADGRGKGLGSIIVTADDQYLQPKDLSQRSASQDVAFGVMCSCYSGISGQDWKRKLAMVNVGFYGADSTISVAYCAQLSGNWFIEAFSRINR